MAYDIGPRIGIEGEAQFRQVIQQINTNLRTLGTEMGAVVSQYDRGDRSTEALTAQNEVLNRQITEQRNKLEQLNSGLAQATERYGENHRVTQGWQQAVNRATADLNNMERELQNNNDELNNFSVEVEEATESTGRFREGLKALGGAVGKAAIGTVKAVGVAAVGAAAALVGITENTKEYRKELSILEQNAKNSGNSFDLMKQELSELTAITDDNGAAVEALSNLMATGFDDNQMVQAFDALSGAIIKFPDTLKIEGLADGLQETLATGAAVGGFAELIERMGGDLEVFNTQLENATTEAEKQQVALDWLAKSGLAEVNAQYREANESTLMAADAQFKLNDALATLSTTVEPAIATIKGSLADVATSLVGMITGTEGATETFKESISTLATNIIEQVNNLIPMMSQMFEALIPALIEGITVALPLLLEATGNILMTLIDGILDSLPKLIESATDIIMTLANGLLENLDYITTSAVEIILAVVNGITQMLPELVPVAVDIILQLAETLISNLDLIIDAGINLILALAEGIINSLPSVIEKAPEIINSFWEAFDKNLFKILEAGVQLIVKLGAGIIQSIPLILANAGEIVKAIFNTISHLNLLNVGKSIITTLGQGLSGMTGNILTIIKQLVTNIINNFKSINWGSVGKDIISGIANGIKGAAGELAQSAVDAAKGALDGTKKFLGIKSPSTIMRDEVGKMIGAGMAEGIADSARQVNAAMQGLNNQLAVESTVKANGTVGSVGQDANLRGSTGEYGDTELTLNLYTNLDGEIVAKNTSKVQFKNNNNATRGMGVVSV